MKSSNKQRTINEACLNVFKLRMKGIMKEEEKEVRLFDCIEARKK